MPLLRRLYLPLLLIAEILFVGLYVAHERALYFWDYAMYHNMAAQWFLSDAPWQQFTAALAQDYNLLFAAPAWIGFALFGTSRLVFILSVFLCWFLAYQAALAFLLARVFALPARQAALYSLLTCLLQPPLWIPLFEGYPDYGAAAGLTLALTLCLPRSQARWRTYLLAGVLLGLAIAFRRHFAYAAVSLLVTMGAFALFFWAKNKNKSLATLALALQAPVIAGLALSATVFAIEPTYVLHALTTDFSVLYQSYTTGFTTIVWYGLVWHGLAWVFIVLAGLTLAWRLLPTAHLGLAFISVYTALWLVIWGAGPAQASLHYFLHAPYIFGSVALTGFWVMAKSCRRCRLAAHGVTLFLVVGMAWTLGFAPETTLSNAQGHSLSLLGAPRPPLRRTDIAQLEALGQTLAETTQETDRIVAVGSSFLWNQDILRAVFSDRLARGDLIARQVWAPEIDGEQAPPFVPLALGTVFIVPDRPQFHLDPSGQKVVASLAAFFASTPKGPFEKDDSAFTLEDGTRLNIWRRKGTWSPLDLRSAFEEIAAFTGVQTPTLALTDPQTLQLLTPLPRGNYQLSIDLPSLTACENLTGVYSFIPHAEQKAVERTFGPPLTSAGLFIVPMVQPFADPAYLSFRFDAQALKHCPLAFNRLQLRSF